MTLSSGGIDVVMVLPFKHPVATFVATNSSSALNIYYLMKKGPGIVCHSPHSLKTLTPHPASVSTYVFCSAGGKAWRKYSLLPAKELEPCLGIDTTEPVTAAAVLNNSTVLAILTRILGFEYAPAHRRRRALLILRSSINGSVYFWRRRQSTSCLARHLHIEEAPITPQCQVTRPCSHPLN